MIVSILDFEEQEHSVLLIVIEKANMDRMKMGDPITLESRRQGGKVMPLIRFQKNLSLLIAYEEDEIELYRLATKGDALLLIKYLERGRRWDPKMDGNAHIIKLNSAKEPEELPSFECPRCHAVSFNPNDVEQGYCGRCHDFTRAGS